MVQRLPVPCDLCEPSVPHDRSGVTTHAIEAADGGLPGVPESRPLVGSRASCCLGTIPVILRNLCQNEGRACAGSQNETTTAAGTGTSQRAGVLHRRLLPMHLSLSRLNHWLPWAQAHPEGL